MSETSKMPKRKRVTAEEREEDRNFLRRCIELYRSMPVLWKVKSDEYMDRDKKAQALQKLLELYQERFPEATTDDVKNKFNSLRTNFRKELRKFNDSKTSGAGREELYVPTCWYFDDMYFIVDQETPSDSINTMEDENDYELSEETDMTYYLEEFRSATMEEPQCSQPDVTRNNQTKKKKRTEKMDDPTEELLRLAVTRLKQPSENDPNFHLASTWAKDISSMQPMQQVLAKKFINEIIFEGQMNTLRRNSVQINQSEHPPVHPSTLSSTNPLGDYFSSFS